MFEKVSRIVLITMFIAMLVIPLVTINLENGKVSEAENRKLTFQPQIFIDDGSINTDFIPDFEAWFNDNIGFRDQMVILNSRIQYKFFNVMDHNSDTILGPQGEFNYATDEIIRSYQHFDLKTQEELAGMTEGFNRAYEYLSAKGIQLYYYQCWDKQSIYPEYFPETVMQYGKISRTDQNIEALKEKTKLCVISPKEELIACKAKYDTYSRWGDTTHWTPRGAYIGYQLLMEEINRNNGDKYKTLKESDYDINITDQGIVLMGGIHKEDLLENFEIRNPQAYKSDEEPKWLSEWANKSRLVYYNDSVSNKDTLLVLGDSYFDNYLYDDLAESFHKVVLIWGDYADEIQQIAEYYEPTIIVVENAERCDRTDKFAEAALKLPR